MGRRTHTESVARIYQAFLSQRTWAQGELSRQVGIGVPTLRKRLDELCALGMPLEKEEDPPNVYWSVPRTWFPGGVLIPVEQLPELLQVLWHSPRGRRRTKLLGLLLGPTQSDPRHAAIEAAVITPDTSEAEEGFLPILEDSIVRRTPVRLRFYSSERELVETRHVSVHRVHVGPPARLVATCHRSESLKWFRVDNIVDARLDESTPFLDADRDQVDRFVAQSIDGFREPSSVEEHVFTVRDPEARWVRKNLLPPMRVEPIEDGIVVRVSSAGALRVARYVVGLGGAATPCSEPLKAVVRELAAGALDNAGETPRVARVSSVQLSEHSRSSANSVAGAGRVRRQG